RFALVFDTSRVGADRLVADGVLRLNGGPFNPETETLTIDLHAAGSSCFRLTVSPRDWRISAGRTRFLYRATTGSGVTTVLLSTMSPGAERFSVRARGVDLAAAQGDPVTMSFASSQDRATQVVATLRTEAHSRVYP